MSITTKSGDDGSTRLVSGERVPKDDPRVEACGEVDELSSLLGFARLACRLAATAEALEGLQRELPRVAGEIGSSGSAFADPIRPSEEEAMTGRILALEEKIPIQGFVLPGRTEASSRIDLARTAARRLERRAVALAASPDAAPSGLREAAGRRSAPAQISSALLRYLNRLSDYLFMLAREEEAAEGKIEFVRRK